jgi:predicted nucleic acid-binding protein
MKVIVDASIWSLALRRSQAVENKYIKELEELIEEVRVQLIGPVRQELLNGIRSEKQFRVLKKHLRAFKDLDIETEDYELASEYFNKARKNGIQGSNTDFLLCAISTRLQMSIFTADKDFINFQSVLPIELHRIRS